MENKKYCGSCIWFRRYTDREAEISLINGLLDHRNDLVDNPDEHSLEDLKRVDESFREGGLVWGHQTCRGKFKPSVPGAQRCSNPGMYISASGKVDL